MNSETNKKFYIMKTNVTIKFETKEEVLTAVEKLISLGFENQNEWNDDIISNDEFWDINDSYYIHIYSDLIFNIYNFIPDNIKTFESFTDFEYSL